MDAKLVQFLSAYKLSGDKSSNPTESYTHTSQMLPNTGKYRLQHSDMEEFWKYYCDRLWTDGDQFKSGVSEKPHEYMPVLADIDMAFGYEEGKTYNEHFYTQEHLATIIKIYFDVLKYCIEDYNPDHMVCFVLEKKKPYVSGVRVKNGFHLHFPFLFMVHHEQDIQIIPRVVKQMDDSKVFENIGMTHSGKVIDTSCTKKHWLLYGSRKDAKLEAYRLTQIVDMFGARLSLSDVMSRVKLLDFDDDEIKMQEPDVECWNPKKDYLEYYLPRILSIHPYNRKIYKCRTDIKVIVKENYKKAREYRGTFESMALPQVIEVCKRLVDMLAPSRADNYESWIEIGWIIYNVTQGCEEGLQMWIDFSRKTSFDNFSETRCIWQWNKMELRGFTMGSLRHFASIDGAEQYKLFVQEESKKRIEESLKGGHVDFAQQLHDLYGTKYVCASIKRNAWFEFKNHRWYEEEDGVSLRTRINTELYPKYNNELGRLRKDDTKKTEKNSQERSREAKSNDSDSDEKEPGDDRHAREEEAKKEEESSAARQKKLNAIILSLKTAGFKDNIMKECKEQFYNRDFLKMLDNNPYLVGFNNGVLDLKKLEFRVGKPDDFISMCTGYDFREYCDEDPEVQEVEIILTKFFPDPVLRKYFMQYCARLLKGGNDAKTFLCFTGSGDNGKSIAMEMIEKALGQYMIKFPTSLVTGKRGQSSAATPELARTHGVRFAILQEPDGNDTINAGILKELTGNDSMYVRNLFSTGKDVKMMLKLALICNKLPRLTAEDQAVWNRTRVCPFESRFPKNNNEVPELWDEQVKRKIFYRDETISERLEQLKAAFMWIMFRTYKECIQTGWMKDPDRVMEATNAYRKNNDIMLQFVSECIKADPKPGSHLNLNDLFNAFKSWFSMSFNGVKMPSKNDLRDDLLKRWGPMTGNRWNGYRMRTSDDDIDEGRSRRLGHDDFTDTTDEEGDTDTDFD